MRRSMSREPNRVGESRKTGPSPQRSSVGMTAQMRSILVVLSKRGWTPLHPLVRPELGTTGPDLSRMVKRGLIEMRQLANRTVHVRITSYGRALVKGKPCV